MFFESIILSFLVVGQTNSGEEPVFKDPFADSPAVEQPAAPPTSPNASDLPTPSESEPQAPGITEPQTPNTTETQPPVTTEQPQIDPAPADSAPLNLPEPPSDSFQFPQSKEIDDDRAPISQEVLNMEALQEDTPVGRWNMGIAAGAGANVNLRPNQIHLELNGGYRLLPKLELGGVLSYRFIDDKLIGFIFTAKGFYRLTKSPRMRIEIAYGGGLGWTLRATQTKFSEGRLTLRAGGEALFYAWPSFALVPGMYLETFPASVKSNGDSTHYFKGKGLPTQLLMTAGIRWEF